MSKEFPVSPDTQRAAEQFARLVEIVASLRAPNGCPWDREQTHASLRRHLIEESYEVVDAIETGSNDDLCEELGDLLMQPVMHAQIAQEENRFAIADVLQGICEKLVRRHPHVFGEVTVSDSGEVLKNWDAIKKAEKQNKIGDSQAGSTPALGDAPAALPALMQALEVSKKAAKLGFEWPDESGVLEKAREEITELETAMHSESRERVAEEVGDLLFTVVNIARWQKVDPELALRDMVRRFRARFSHMENAAREAGLELGVLPPAQWEELWKNAKSNDEK
jgi:MazG family protein